MKEYISLFETTAAYNAAKDSLDLPNVAYCEDQNKLHYNPDFLCKLTLSNGNVIELREGNIVTEAMISDLDVSDLIVGIELGNLCTSVASYAFTGCNNITSIKVSRTVNNISSAPFIRSNTNNFTSIIVDSENPTYDSRNNCNAIIKTSTNELVLGGVNTIIPNSITSIGLRAFCNCTGLTTITIPESITYVDGLAFEGCTGLPVTNYIRYADTVAVAVTDKTRTNYSFKLGVKFLSSSLFSGCTSLQNLSIPNSVILINSSLCSNCTNLSNLYLGTGITNIPYSLCANSKIQTINIPSGVTSISSSAFVGCTSLYSVSIGNSNNGSNLRSIGSQAFSINLMMITSYATSAPSISPLTFQNVKTNGTLRVPQGSTGYDTWMGTGNYYLGKYNWTKTEISS